MPYKSLESQLKASEHVLYNCTGMKTWLLLSNMVSRAEKDSLPWPGIQMHAASVI